MDALDCIMTRRSVRKYLEGPVDDKTIEAVLKAGAAAPSAGNQQPWQFVLIKDKSRLEAVATFHPHAKMLPGAAFAVLICMSTEGRYPGLAVDDCGAATQNMLLACHALGLGAVWIGVHHEDGHIARFREIFGVPENYIPYSLIACGRTDEPGHDAARFRPEMVHQDGW